MLRNMSFRIATWAIIGFLLLSAVGSRPAGAMIFPELLSLVRVDNETHDSVESEPANEVYVVKAGDTLWSLGRRYGVDWKTIAYANNLSLNGKIRPGQSLSIPTGEKQYHIVKQGENLWQIARQYNIDMELLASANDIRNTDYLPVGMRLVIPIEGEEAVPAYARQDLSSRYKGYWKWPVKGQISSTYGPRGAEFHHGLDIAADVGEKIYPLHAGTVKFSGWLNNIYGRAVIIDHGDGIKTVYAHNSKNLVKQGARVKTSDPIAEIGSTGRSTGPHLHLEVHVDGKTIDPLILLEH